MSSDFPAFKDVLASIADQSDRAWVYLPWDGNWGLDSRCTVLESEEVAPDDEDDPEAGIPEMARRNGLRQTIPVVTLQDVVSNALAQKPEATLEELFRAFIFYYARDAFIDFEHPETDL